MRRQRNKRGLSLTEVLVYIAIFALFSTIVIMLIRDTFRVASLSTGASALYLNSNKIKEKIDTALESTALFLDRGVAKRVWDYASLHALGDPLPVVFPLIYGATDINVTEVPQANWGNAIAVIRLKEFKTITIDSNTYSVKVYEFLLIYPTKITGSGLRNRIALAYIISSPFVSARDLESMSKLINPSDYSDLTFKLYDDQVKVAIDLEEGNPFKIYDIRNYPSNKRVVRISKFFERVNASEIIPEFRKVWSFKQTDFSVAFNSNANIPGYKPSIDIPAFMSPTDEWYPSGFEVCIYGSKSARTIFYRLTLLLRKGSSLGTGLFYVTGSNVTKVINETL